MAMGFAEFLKNLQAAWAGEADADREPSNLIVLRRVDSTQKLCRRLHLEYKNEEGEVPPVAVVGYEQISGSGRHGRPWESPGGCGVYATLIRRMGGAQALRLLPLAVAVALAETLDAILDRPCGLRWPNDLMVDGLKIGGILVDVVSRTEEDGSLAFVGFGVNHCGRPVPGVSASVADHCHEPPTVATLAARLMRSVDAHLKSLEGEEDLLRRYAAGSVHRPGDRLRCRVGQDVKVGAFRGFAPGGFLRLETADGIELLTSGAVESLKEPVSLKEPEPVSLKETV